MAESGFFIGWGDIRTGRTAGSQQVFATMEAVEFEPERIMRVETHDGPMTIHGWARFEMVGPDATRLTIGGEIPGVDDAVAGQVRTMMDRSTANTKSLVESEA